MSTQAYDSTSTTLHQVAGKTDARINQAISKADASLNNQSDSIEAGTTATAAHAVGDYINYGSNKQFAKVTQAIAIGDSIVNGTNVDNQSIGGVLSTLNGALSKHEFDTAQSLTLGTEFTAPSDGYVHWSGTITTQYSHVAMDVNGKQLCSDVNSGTYNLNYSVSRLLFVRKGTILKLRGSGTGIAGEFYPLI